MRSYATLQLPSTRPSAVKIPDLHIDEPFTVYGSARPRPKKGKSVVSKVLSALWSGGGYSHFSS